MFAKKIVSTANALAAGWGNLGAGITHLVVGTALFPLFKFLYDRSAEKAWHTVCVVPAAIGFAMGIVIYFVTDDAPKGN
jgi:NNP family nitrate/nitrite transporter-like MFS transporter